jgi:hypothetical protein
VHFKLTRYDSTSKDRLSKRLRAVIESATLPEYSGRLVLGPSRRCRRFLWLRFVDVEADITNGPLLD